MASFDDLVHSAITPVPSRDLRDEVQDSLAQTFGFQSWILKATPLNFKTNCVLFYKGLVMMII